MMTGRAPSSSDGANLEPGGQRLKGLVCASDHLIRETLSSAVQRCGYELVGSADSALDALELTSMTHPDLLVIDNALPTRPGIEWVPELRERVPDAAILLIANDPGISERAHGMGVLGVVYRTEMTELDGALGRARRWLTDPETRQPFERRGGGDRRQGQDWTKVTHERRAGAERREHDLGPPESRS